MLSYRQLKTKLVNMDDKDLDSNVTVHSEYFDEFFAVDHLEFNNAEQEDDRLDDGHPVLIVFDREPPPFSSLLSIDIPLPTAGSRRGK